MSKYLINFIGYKVEIQIIRETLKNDNNNTDTVYRKV